MNKATNSENKVIHLKAINLTEKAGLFEDRWSPKVVAEMNDYQFKLAKLEGEFEWHKHDDTDEAFLIQESELTIELSDGVVHLKAGDMYVVPKGVMHKPVAESVCTVMIIEPKGVFNTGEVNERTAENDVWI